MTAVLAPAEASAHARDAHRWRRAALAAPAWIPALMIALGGWSHRWMDEDAFINFRIVDQIFAGNGPVFNAGERVEAATSPLWLFILVAGRAVFGAFVSIEWIALVAGLGAAVAAFAVGGHTARVQHRGADGVVFPVGLALVAAVAVVWDFSTSGLEMSLVWLWLAGSWWALVTVARADQIGRRTRIGCCVTLGLAPLVRPELTFMMLFLAGAWFVLARPRRIGCDLAAMFAVPVAYELFRMGYYAMVVPNTALAKDAGGLHLGQGWAYLADFATPYRLWFSAALILAAVVLADRVRRDRRVAVATAAMLAAALADVIYIVAIGGDYMHGRLLLPAFFAFGLPASVVVRRDTAIVASVAGLTAVWALVSVVWFRPPPPPPGIGFGPAPIADWRTVSGATMKPADIAIGLNGPQAAAAYARRTRLFRGHRQDPPNRARPGRVRHHLGFDRRSRL